MARARLLAALALLLALGACTGLFFQPMKQHVFDPASIGFTYRDVDFAAADGTALHGWYFPAEGEPSGSILFLHGNAENISTHFANVAWLAKSGFAVLVFDYRGYGRSAGSPDLDGLHQDVAAAMEALLRQPETDPDRIAVIGQSLGGALALTAMAASPMKDRLRAVIIEGAFSGYRDIAREKLAGFWLTWPLQQPLGWTIDDRYHPLEAAARIRPVPLLVILDEADTIIPPHHGEALFAAAGEPKTLWRLPGTGHIQAFATVGNRHRLVEFLRAAMAGPA
ncbi:MAG: alpha/beta fold hydrolase [Geminicoccaceae bacterium]